jgi:hypothetical protein
MKVAAAAAIIVAGPLVGPAPARAIPPVPLDPPCLDWSYTGTLAIVQSDGNSVRIANWSGASGPLTTGLSRAPIVGDFKAIT